MQLGIFAKTFAGANPSEILGAARDAGYSCVQYNMACSGLASMPGTIPPGVAETVAAAARTAGVRVAAVSATANMIHPDPAVRERGHASLRVIAAAAHGMGTGLLTLCTGTRDAHDPWRRHAGNDAPDAWRDLLGSMEIAIAIAEDHDIDLGVEPERANVVDSAAKARRLIDDLASPRVKIVIDPANLVETEPAEEQRRIVAAAIDLLADRIVMAHAKDRTPDGAFATAGTGVLDYPHYLRCLKRAGFQGPLVAHGLSASEASGVARFLAREAAAAGLTASETLA